ncbi:MAG: ATP-dependent RecD-like DNA helicase [Desulfatirhabdiaceae bacterium]
MNSERQSTSLEGHIEKITFYNPDNHYTIARFRVANADTRVTVVGFLPEPSPGENLFITGFWDVHARYGQQLKIEHAETRMPSTVDGIREYLKSGFITGVSAKKLSGIVKHFGESTLDIIETHSERLTEVKGIGEVIALRIAESWKSHHAARRLMQFLEEAGVPASHTARILKQYGMDSVDILTANPYQAALDIPGVGFYIADRIAQHLGAPPDQPARIRACVLYILEQAAQEGHTGICKSDLLYRLSSLFSIENDRSESEIDSLVQGRDVILDRHIHCDESVVFLKHLHDAELGISRRIHALQSVPVHLPPMNPDDIADAVRMNLAIQPSPEQLSVLENILQHKVAIITGGPGTGKTTLIRSICAVFKRLGKKIALAAPTGRASRRLSEVTRARAQTIHRLLLYDPVENVFLKNRDDPLEIDVAIIDETSMVDVILMLHLVNALPPTASLILVGDRFQLPSVGPGNVLADMIDSGVIKTYELTEIFRQAAESPIVMNAHRVRQGAMPVVERGQDPGDLSEFYFIEQSNPDIVLKHILDMSKNRIPQTFGYDPIGQIQVITPMHKGIVGTIHLNQMLQKTLNPDPIGIEVYGTAYKTGDKVMHLKNNYAKEIFNGDIGVVSGVDRQKIQVTVDYDDRIVTYDRDELQDLTLAYAISVHKSQGSEYPAVIVPVMNQHFAMLQRNLLYTAITRGKNLVILIGTRQALQTAVNNNQNGRRLSILAVKLKNT